MPFEGGCDAHLCFNEGKIMRNVASVAELTKSFFAEINKVENRKGLEKLHVMCRRKELSIARLP
jgi:hypothetical protein